ncbi:Hypothetical predicted protein [Pelobates cultripes]|uniref:Uncharacterized protein n=1 Tax=Pelobates cultripes TaxID=61616 RepID=A0AAD1QYW7_PELCU|nr:Hypothetical predicted protein [Pelobates cultripes]
MMVEGLSKCSRRNNLHVRGLPEAPNEGPLTLKMVECFQQLLPEIPEEKASRSTLKTRVSFTWGHLFKIIAFTASLTHTILQGTDPATFFCHLAIVPPLDFALPGSKYPLLTSFPWDWYTTGKNMETLT